MNREKFEVELKFCVDSFDEVENLLASHNANLLHSTEQRDQYYRHPCRNFAETDEALRIRRTGDDVCITYKGPKVDATTKTRRELELQLHDGEQAATQMSEMLRALGFTDVAEVRKQRRRADVCWKNETVEVALDDVTNVGQFVELELIADDNSVEAAKNCLVTLAERLDLHKVERRSYLELFLDRPSH